MLLTIDAGNTNTVFALKGKVWRCRTETGRTADEYASWLYPLFQQAGMQMGQITDVIIASVVPGANFNLRRLCTEYLNVTPLFIGERGVNSGIAIKLPKPEELGADRIVNAVAAAEHYKLPAIIIDFGTATTFDIVDKDGAYIGGAIAPGINLSLDALHRAAAKLPKIDIAAPQSVIGTDTVSAMRSGVFWGYVGMMEGILKRMETEIGAKCTVIMTGGLAELFRNSIEGVDHIDNDLTLKGLELIHARNRKNAA